MHWDKHGSGGTQFRLAPQLDYNIKDSDGHQVDEIHDSHATNIIPVPDCGHLVAGGGRGVDCAPLRALSVGVGRVELRRGVAGFCDPR